MTHQRCGNRYMLNTSSCMHIQIIFRHSQARVCSLHFINMLSAVLLMLSVKLAREQSAASGALSYKFQKKQLQIAFLEL